MLHRTSAPICPMNETLYVIAVISNPVRYRTRYDLYRRFAQHVEQAGAVLYTVEVAFGRREFEVTEANNPKHIQLRTKSEIWHKENMINLGIERLPQDWRYVAWVDADVSFLRPDWVQETIHQLQHYDVVQMWSTAHDLNPQMECNRTFRSFAWCYLNHINHPFDDKPREDFSYGRPYWHTGYAWAAKRKAIDHLGGLMDYCILGAADHHMALAMIGEVDRSLPPRIDHTWQYYKKLKEWEARAEKFIKRNIGVVEGGLVHYWHGKKKDRRYQDRWKILVNNQFDPSYDLKRDWQGLYQLTDRNIKLRDDLRFYFRNRDEDSIDCDE